jgi:hypothetical protein
VVVLNFINFPRHQSVEMSISQKLSQFHLSRRQLWCKLGERAKVYHIQEHAIALGSGLTLCTGWHVTYSIGLRHTGPAHSWARDPHELEAQKIEVALETKGHVFR